MDNWQKVYTTNQQHKAEIVKAVLEENDISAVVVSKKDSLYQLGNYEVYVSSENVLSAVKMINDDIHFE
ncbi:MAG: putative signal transducing protein [Imperialibacter sp.]|jgi:type III secretory pathway lipoprotein EscJ|uniref:putative signal transducing protein n=1 Tax=Imperialibacter sp. TaxID=2038411 RepID=UPI0032EBF979